MGVEIERKFLVDKNNFRPNGKGIPVKQIYLKRDETHSIRTRIIGSRAFITIKKSVSAMVRNEFEYEIPLEDAREMFSLFGEMPSVEKIRFYEIVDEKEWVVDQFWGANQGLVLAEIELESNTSTFKMPVWVLKEVTNDPRYHNSNLAVNPFAKWENQNP